MPRPLEHLEAEAAVHAHPAALAGDEDWEGVLGAAGQPLADERAADALPLERLGDAEHEELVAGQGEAWLRGLVGAEESDGGRARGVRGHEGGELGERFRATQTEGLDVESWEGFVS